MWKTIYFDVQCQRQWKRINTYISKKGIIFNLVQFSGANRGATRGATHIEKRLAPTTTRIFVFLISEWNLEWNFRYIFKNNNWIGVFWFSVLVADVGDMSETFETFELYTLSPQAGRTLWIRNVSYIIKNESPLIVTTPIYFLLICGRWMGYQTSQKRTYLLISLQSTVNILVNKSEPTKPLEMLRIMWKVNGWKQFSAQSCTVAH